MKILPKSLKGPQGTLLIGLAAIIVILLGYYFVKTGGQGTPAPVVEVTQTDHVRGAAGAKVTLVEFGDFQCPACGAYEPMVEKVMNDNKTIAQFVFRNFPLTQLHQNALLGAKAAEAAGVQGKYWEMHDMLYAKQTEWGGALNAKALLIGYAKTLKLDTAKFEADLGSTAIEDKIRAEYSEGVKLNIQGTPTFFINGKMITNPGSVEAFDKLIKDAAK